MKVTPRQKRAERRSRNQTQLDMNLVSLIDVFTIMIFFLLSNSGGLEVLPSPKGVHLPASVAEMSPRDTVVVSVSGSELTVDGRRIALVDDVLRSDTDLVEPLSAELARQAARTDKEAPGKRLTIMGDKDIPYRLLRKVMATSAQAGFVDVSFAVRQRFAS